MATPVNTPDKVTYFAETDYRSKRIKFGIRDQDRERHMYVIGKTGMGKSTMLENLAIQDIANGEGLCFIDPHGGTAETLLSYVPEHRVKDVIYFAPFDQEHPVALNVMEDIGRDKRPLVASGLIGAFKKVWVDAWSARMEYILSNALLALLEFSGATLLGVNRIFADKNYRSLIVNNITDPSVKAFWVDEYAKYSDKFATEATAAIQNKVGQFAANPLIRNMVGQSKSTFDIRKVMDDRKILIVNLSKGRIGEGNANLVGSMLITKIYLAEMSRADVGPEVVRGLPPFYLYVDEFQSFANESFADILSEARKYKLSLTVAHQYIEQMSEEVRAAVFGNVGTMCAFRVGAYDAEVLEKEFAPAFTAEDMVNLGFAQIYLKLMIKGVGSAPFSATTLNRPPFPPRAYTNEVIAASREQFGRPRAVVEEEIKKWHEPIPEPPRDPNAPLIPETRKYASGTRPLRPAIIGASASYTGVLPRTPEGLVPRQDVSRSVSPVTKYPHLDVEFPSDLETRRPSGGSHEELTPYQSHLPEIPPSMLPAVPRSAEPPMIPERRNITPRPPAPPHGGFGRVDPPAQNSSVHRPFREEFVNLQSAGKNLGESFVRTLRSVAGGSGGVRPEPLVTERGHIRLQSDLSTVSVRGDAGRSGATARAHTPATAPASLSSLKSQAKKDKGPSMQNLSSLKTLIDAAFATRPEPERAGDAKEKTPPLSQKESFYTAPVAQTTATPPSLLGDMRTAQGTKEVPEDVLRGVLAD